MNVTTPRPLSYKSLEKTKNETLLKLELKNNRKDFQHELNKDFSLPCEEFLSVRKLKRTNNILPFKLYSKQQDKDRFKRGLDYSIYKRYKIHSKELQKRLHVQDPTNNIIAVTDINADFYSYIDGRPIRLHIPTFKTLKESVNKLIHIKQDIGIKRDCCYNIDQNCHTEMRIFDSSVKRLTNQVKSFDKFISDDYKKSMAYLTKWDIIRGQIDLQVQELENVAIEKFTIMSKVMGLEYKYSLQQKYGRFLYYLSPPSWRLSNRDFARSCEIEAKGFDFGHSNEEDNFAVIFEKMRNICYGVPVKPALYFTRPKDLVDVFDVMETQQLHYYTHVHHLAPYTKILKNEIRSLKDVIFQDTAVVANSIQGFENFILFSEQRCAQLKDKFFEILYGLFYKTVAVSDVLKLTLHLEFCYEKVLSDKPINLDIISMAKSLENVYMDFSKKLDSIKSEAVRLAMTKHMDIESLKMKRANNATTELRLFYRLQQELLRSHGIFTGTNKYTPIKCNTYAPNKKKVSMKNNMKIQKKKSLTEDQLEYLRLFTDWTEFEDPGLFLQSLSNIDDVNSFNTK